MKSSDILKAIGQTDEELIEKALPKSRNKSKTIKPVSLIAAILAVIIIGGIWFYPSQRSGVLSAFAVAEAEYPDTPFNPYSGKYYESFLDENGNVNSKAIDEAHEIWWESNRNKNKLAQTTEIDIDVFFRKTVAKILACSEENRVYSPLSLYLALGMLAELTDGNSRKQILDLLGYESIEVLREHTEIIWNINYCDDGLYSSTLASSLWLNKDVQFNKDTINTIKDSYYASTFQGEMGSDTFNNALKDWINTQTGGNLTDYASDVSLNERDFLALITTVFFEAAWDNEFKEEDVTDGIFRSVKGNENCRFMNDTVMGNYFWGENFSAVYKTFDGNSKMWFILPDENSGTEEALKDEEVLDFILTGSEFKSNKWTLVNLSVPKFDVSSSLSLNESLHSLGITDVFDSAKADFTPMLKNSQEVFLDKVDHCARVSIDEKGCTATAFTVLNAAGAGAPEDEVDFIIDRPFIFVVTNYDGFPLFVGTVNSLT